MSDFSDPWSDYVRLQAALAQKNRVDDSSWGLEAGLNGILRSFADSQPPRHEEIDRFIASESRRERHRAHLRFVYFPRSSGAIHPEVALHYRHKLLAIKAQIDDHDWTILYALAEGHSYREVATAEGVTPGNLRVRVLRVRRRLEAWIAA